MLIPQGNIVLRRDFELVIAELRNKIDELERELIALKQPETKRPYTRKAEVQNG